MSSPHLNFELSFAIILICVIPKLFGYYDSFNKPSTRYSSNKDSMMMLASALFACSLPMFLDAVLDHFSSSKNKKSFTPTRLVTSISTIVVAFDVLHKLGYSPYIITPVSLHLSFDFIVWCLRLNMTAGIMFAISVENPQLFPAWQTCLFTMTTASYGLLRYVVASEVSTSGYYLVLFALRIMLVMNVHITLPYWIYMLCKHSKWSVSDYAVIFYLLVFIFMTLDFISDSIYKVLYESFFGAFINIKGFHMERTMECQLIAMVVLTIVPGRLARIELIESKDFIIETKRAFVSYISHELRTPLNTVFAGMKLALKPYENDSADNISLQEGSSSSNKLRQDKKRTEQKEILQETSLACGVALEILNDFLMFDKLEQNNLALNQQHCGLIDFMSNAIRVILVQIREKKIKLKLVNYLSNSQQNLVDVPDTNEMFQVDRIDNEGHTCSSKVRFQNIDSRCFIQASDMVDIDKHKVNQVIRNLLSNAIKFTPTGGNIAVLISFEANVSQDQPNESEQKGSLVIQVTDSGAGMSITDQKRLFKEVVQFRPHELQGGGGSGLGLMITKGIVDHHNGSIDVHSAGEGTGSTFTVRLPMVRTMLVHESVAVTDSSSSSSKFEIKSILKTSTSMLRKEFNRYEQRLQKDNNSELLLQLTVQKKLIDITKDEASDKVSSTVSSKSVGTLKSNESDSCIIRNSSSSSSKISSNSSSSSSSSSYIDDQHPVELVCSEKFETNSSDNSNLANLSLKLLLVDDSRMSRKMLGRSLTLAGFFCEKAENGLQAVNMIKEGIKFDAILMDSHMPQMDGPTATSEIRKLGFKGQIIGITGDTADRDINHFLDHGASRILIKPVDADIVSETLIQIVSNSKD